MRTADHKRKGYHGIRGMGSDLVEGLTYATKDVKVRALIIMAGGYYVFGMAFLMVFAPLFALDVLGIGEGGFGYLMAVTGVGGVLGALAVAGMNPSRCRGVLIIAIVIGIGLLQIVFAGVDLPRLGRSRLRSRGGLGVRPVVVSAHHQRHAGIQRTGRHARPRHESAEFGPGNGDPGRGHRRIHGGPCRGSARTDHLRRLLYYYGRGHRDNVPRRQTTRLGPRMSQNGYLVIADISGYTAFLSGSELEHAEDSLSALLSLMIEQTRSPLVLSRLEGDAVISYAPKETVLDGQTLVEIIETTYVEFGRARERMVLNTSCTCNACKNIPNLDLKFFVHYGSFLLQDLGTHIELIGNDVNLVHRLTKNTIVEQTVIRAYAAYTEQASEALEIGEFCRTLVQHSESYEEFPGVVVFVQDLNDVWERARTLAPGGIKPEDTLITQSQEFPGTSDRLVGLRQQTRLSNAHLRIRQHERRRPVRRPNRGRIRLPVRTWKQRLSTYDCALGALRQLHD